MKKRLTIIGDYNPAWETHAATDRAIEHSANELGVEIEVEWVSTDVITNDGLAGSDGVWVASGAPYQGRAHVIESIRWVRDNGVPCFGTCQGFQHILLEFAESQLGMVNPGHEEYGDADPLIYELPCSLRGREMSLSLSEGSLAREIYGTADVVERYYCSFGVHPKFVSEIKGGGIRVSGVDGEGQIRVVEYPDLPFMMGTLFVPQVRSTEEVPHPLVTAFLRAVVG